MTCKVKYSFYHDLSYRSNAIYYNVIRFYQPRFIENNMPVVTYLQNDIASCMFHDTIFHETDKHESDNLVREH